MTIGDRRESFRPIIVAEKLASDTQEVQRQVDAACIATGLLERLRHARSMFIKPNLTYPVYKEGVTTRARFVEHLVESVAQSHPSLKIFIGEGEGGYNSFSMSKAMENMGFTEIAERYPQVEIVNLSRVGSREIVLETPRGPYGIQLPELFFTDVDVSVSVPLAKIHCMTTLTLSLKNLWGCLPDVMRLRNHFMFPHIIFRVAKLLKFEYAFLDGKFGLDNNGPMDGDVVDLNWFVAGNSLGAFDAVVSRMMGFDWKKIPHLREAGAHGFVPNIEDISILGDPERIKRKFVLRRTPWNYPALAAFHSKPLTQLFYFSKWSGFMHDVMYTFRKRPITIDQDQRP